MPHLDGNVLAGAASDLFAFDLTTTEAQCASCYDIAPLGRSLVFGPPMGFVARCRSCDSVLIVVVERPEGHAFDARGLRWMRIGNDAHAAGEKIRP